MNEDKPSSISPLARIHAVLDSLDESMPIESVDAELKEMGVNTQPLVDAVKGMVDEAKRTRSLARSSRKWALAVAAVAVVFLLTGAVGAKKFHDLLQKYEEARNALGIDKYITWANDDEGHPPRDTENARPLSVVGQELILRGKASTNILKAVKLRVEPGLEPGQPHWEKILPIQSQSGEEIGSFQLSITVPKDGKLRKAFVSLIPHAEAKAASPVELAEKNLTYKEILVACLPAGPLAYAPPEPVHLDIPKNIDAHEMARNISGVSLRDGWLVLLIHPLGVPGQPWYSQNFGEPLRVHPGQPFTVPCTFADSIKEFAIIAIVVPSRDDLPFVGDSVKTVPTTDRHDRPLERTPSVVLTRKGPS